MAWEKVVELLAVNRLVAPRSELSIHEKWFPQTAMSALLDSDERVAEKDRLYRTLDRMVEHKEALEKHLTQMERPWQLKFPGCWKTIPLLEGMNWKFMP